MLPEESAARVSRLRGRAKPSPSFAILIVAGEGCAWQLARRRRRTREAKVRFTLPFFCLALLFALVGCAETPSLESYAYARPPNGGVYVLRPNDQLRVRVYNETEVSGDYQIDGNGFLSIPLAGQIKAAGLTAGKLEAIIRSRLEKGIIRDPRVAVQVTGYGPVYVQGEVKRGGEYPYHPGLTVMDAVASAGGLTYRADENKVFVRRAGASGEEVYPANAAVPLYPGDNIRVPERFF